MNNTEPNTTASDTAKQDNPKKKNKKQYYDRDNRIKACEQMCQGITNRLDGITQRLDGIQMDRDALTKLGKKVKTLAAVTRVLSNMEPLQIEYTYHKEESFVLPVPSKEGSIGDDLVTTKDIHIPPGRSVIPINFIINLPPYIEAKIETRSGFASKGILGKVRDTAVKGIFALLNKPVIETEAIERYDADVIHGKVDPGYFNPIGVIVNNHGPAFTLPANTHIAQITYYRTVRHIYIEKDSTDEFSSLMKNRGGGFGHSTDTDAAANQNQEQQQQ